MMNNCNITYGVRRQLFIFSTAIILILLLIIGVIFGTSTSKTLHNLTLTNYTQTTQQMLTDFQKGTSSLTNLTQNYLNNPYIQESLLTSELGYQSEKYLLSSLYYPNNNYLDYCFYVNNDGSVYYSSVQALDVIGDADLMQSFYRLTENTYSRPFLFSDKNAATDASSLFMVRRIRHLSINCEPGLLVLHLGPNFYGNIFSNINIQKECSYFLLDPQFTVVYSRNTDSLSPEALHYLKENFNTNTQIPYFYDDVYYFAVKDDATGFLLVSHVPQKVIQKSSNAFFQTLMIVLFIAISVSVFLVLLMSSHFTRPIRYLSDNMKSFSLDSLGQPIYTQTNTELDTISAGYNQMLDNILKLLQTVESDQAQLRANEYNLLLHQVNPHFLYNTLDNIHMLARLNGDEKTVKLICALSSYLRISLSKGHDVIPVSEELSHIESYMIIEQIRTNNLFTYTIEADSDTVDLLIPKLIIQPIVENSIKYGFSEIDADGHISISIKKCDSQLAITVINNGKPINADTMEVLNKMPYQPLEKIADTFPNKSGGYGIANVICRLKLRYDTSFSMRYEAANGTTCIIILPM